MLNAIWTFFKGVLSWLFSSQSIEHVRATAALYESVATSVSRQIGI